MELDLAREDQRRIDKVITETDSLNSYEQVVREALGRFLIHKEAEINSPTVIAGRAFECEIINRSGNKPITLQFQPQPSSDLRIKYHQRGNPPHTALLETANTVIGADAIEEWVNELSEVSRCEVPNTTSDIRVTLYPAPSEPLEEIIDTIRTQLVELVKERDRRIREEEETITDARERALADYWSYYS